MVRLSQSGPPTPKVQMLYLYESIAPPSYLHGTSMRPGLDPELSPDSCLGNKAGKCKRRWVGEDCARSLAAPTEKQQQDSAQTGQ